MGTRKASVKETGEELSEEEWARFEDATEEARTERSDTQGQETQESLDQAPHRDRPAKR